MEQHPTRVVVALDRSEYAPIVLDHALDLATRYPSPELHFITILERGDDVDEVKRQLAELVLVRLEDYACDWRMRMHVRAGRPYEEIASFAGEIRANLIVMGRFGVHHRGRLGSVASRVLDLAPCPLLVVGLVDDAPEPRDQCLRCVRVRAESDGERWFCEAHVAPDRESIAVSPASSSWIGGGPMW